jgi:hypothetical protein
MQLKTKLDATTVSASFPYIARIVLLESISIKTSITSTDKIGAIVGANIPICLNPILRFLRLCCGRGRPKEYTP